MWDQFIYLFPNFRGCTVEVWKWINNFIPHFTGHVLTYPCWNCIIQSIVWTSQLANYHFIKPLQLIYRSCGITTIKCREMETLYLPAFRKGNVVHPSLVESPQRPVIKNLSVFLVVSLSKLLKMKQVDSMLLICEIIWRSDTSRCHSLVTDLNTLRPRKMDAISQTTFSNAFSWMKIFVPNGIFNNITALVQIMAWRRPGERNVNKRLSKQSRRRWIRAHYDIIVIENYLGCSFSLRVMSVLVQEMAWRTHATSHYLKQ